MSIRENHKNVLIPTCYMNCAKVYSKYAGINSIVCLNKNFFVVFLFKIMV